MRGGGGIWELPTEILALLLCVVFGVSARAFLGDLVDLVGLLICSLNFTSIYIAAQNPLWFSGVLKSFDPDLKIFAVLLVAD